MNEDIFFNMCCYGMSKTIPARLRKVPNPAIPRLAAPGGQFRSGILDFWSLGERELCCALTR